MARGCTGYFFCFGDVERVDVIDAGWYVRASVQFGVDQREPFEKPRDTRDVAVVVGGYCYRAENVCPCIVDQ